MHNVVYDVIGFAALIYFIIRQVTPQRPSRLRFYILPIVGLFFAYKNLPHPVPESQLWDAVTSVGISIPFGFMQAYFTRLYESGGEWLMQGDWRYVASWLALLLLRIVIAMAFGGGTHGAETAASWIIALEVAAIWGVRSVVLQLRYPQLQRVLAEGRRQ